MFNRKLKIYWLKVDRLIVFKLAVIFHFHFDECFSITYYLRCDIHKKWVLAWEAVLLLWFFLLSNENSKWIQNEFFQQISLWFFFLAVVPTFCVSSQRRNLCVFHDFFEYTLLPISQINILISYLLNKGLNFITYLHEPNDSMQKQW